MTWYLANKQYLSDAEILNNDNNTILIQTEISIQLYSKGNERPSYLNNFFTQFTECIIIVVVP